MQNEQISAEVEVLNPNQRGIKLDEVVIQDDEAGKLEVGMTRC